MTRSTSVIIFSIRISEALPISDATLSETSSHETSEEAIEGLAFILASREVIASLSSSIFLRACSLNCSNSRLNASLPISSSISPNSSAKWSGNTRLQFVYLSLKKLGCLSLSLSQRYEGINYHPFPFEGLLQSGCLPFSGHQHPWLERRSLQIAPAWD